MIGLGIAFLVALALMAAGGGKASAKPMPGAAPDLPPVVPGPPDPAKPTVTTTGKSGTKWITQQAAFNGSSGYLYVDVFLPDGQLGTHPTYRVLRYAQGPGSGRPRTFAESAAGVDAKIVALAVADFNLNVGSGPIDIQSMSAELQKELSDALAALTVNSDGQVVGPVDAVAIQFATGVAGDLERAGFGAAGTALRRYIQAAATLVPHPPENKKIPLPASMPADLQAQVNRALQLERDPAKLTAIMNALQAYQPQTPDIVNAVQMLQALILQVQAAKSAADALKKIQEVVQPPVQPVQPEQHPTAPTQPTQPTQPPVQPAQPTDHAPGSRTIRQGSRGSDVAYWQGVIGAKQDGIFGPTTARLTKQWQASRRLQADGIVGPKTWAAAQGGAAPSSPLPDHPLDVPAQPVPGPVPQPKSPVEVAADAMVRNLKAVQGSFGMPGAHGKEDMSIVKRFQTAAGVTADGKAGPGTMVLAAINGQSDLPLVMYWPKVSSAANVIKYRSDLQAVADRARGAGDLSGAAALEASAAREHGEGKISTGELVP